MANNHLYVQAQTFTVASPGSNVGDITLTLSSFNQISQNSNVITPLTMANFGTKGYGTLEPGNQNYEEAFTFTGVTTNLNGSITLTGVSTQSFVSPYTETAGLAVSHAGGVSMVITNTAGFYANFADKNDDATIAGAWTFTTPPFSTTDPTLNTQVANKEYVDGVVIAGGINGNATTKGIFQSATVAQQATATATGSTGARLILENANTTVTSTGASQANLVVISNASGVVDPTLLPDATSGLQGVVQIATGTQLAAGTATGTTGASVVPNGASFKNFSSGASDASKVPVLSGVGNLDPSFLSQTLQTGSAVTYGYALYTKSSDGLQHLAASNAAESTYNFTGIAQDAAAGTGINIRVALPGQIAVGLTSLTAGSYYYLTNTAGVISTTPGTNVAKIGLALTTTTMLVISPKFIASGSFTYDNTAVSPLVTTIGFRPDLVTFRAFSSIAGQQIISVGDSSNTCVLSFAGSGTTDFSRDASHAWNVGGTSDSSNGTVTITSTGFSAALVISGGPPTQYVDWSAFNV